MAGESTGVVSYRIPKFRRHTIALTFFLLLSFAFLVSSVSLPVFGYASGNGVSIEITHWRITLCPGDAESARVSACSGFDLPNRLCPKVEQRIYYAGLLAVLSVLILIVDAIFVLVELLGTPVTPRVVLGMTLLVWLLNLIQWTLLSDVFGAALCKGTSLKALGFVYKAGWILSFLSWFFLTPVILYYWYCVRRSIRKGDFAVVSDHHDNQQHYDGVVSSADAVGATS